MKNPISTILILKVILFLGGSLLLSHSLYATLNPSPQPDTLVYHDFFDDPDQPIYTLTGLEQYWVTVRFTPDSTFTVLSVYFVVENITGSNDPCYIYLALDDEGRPDSSGILAGPIMVEGPLPHKTVIQVDLDSAVVVDSLQDFHAIVSSGGFPSYSVALELPADFPHRTGHSRRSHSGPFRQYVFPTPADAIIAVGGYYRWEQQKVVDLQTTCLSNGLDLFFPDGQVLFGLNFSSEITNTGLDTASGYSLSWSIRDQYDYIFTHYDTQPPPIPPGSSLNVTCPSPWITETIGEYVISDDVSLEEDIDTTNNTSQLEQYVNLSPHFDLHYDDGEADDTHVIPEDAIFAVRFSPWSRIESIDSLSLYFTDESSCQISILDGFYPYEEPGEPLFVSNDTTFQSGWHMLRFEDLISPLRSTFFVALQGAGGQVYLGIDNDLPLTTQSCLPPQFFKSANLMTQWQPADTGDPLLTVYVTKTPHSQLQYLELLDCTVEPDSLSPGEIAEVKVHWEYFDIAGGGAQNLTLITGLANYPSLVPLVLDTLIIQNVEAGLYIDSMNLRLPAPPPGTEMGISAAYIESEPPEVMWDFILGEIFQIVTEHHLMRDGSK